METIMVYEVNGKRFDDPIDAKKYEAICKEVEEIMEWLLPRTKDIEDGCNYNRQEIDIVKMCFKSFCLLCSKVIPAYKKWFSQAARGKRHLSHIGRVLSDYGNDYPILQTTFFRFRCISFENGYEFQQPYYVTHQEEFFKDMEKRLKYKNNGN